MGARPVRSWELGILWLGGGFDKKEDWGGAVYGRYFRPGDRSTANYQCRRVGGQGGIVRRPFNGRDTNDM